MQLNLLNLENAYLEYAQFGIGMLNLECAQFGSCSISKMILTHYQQPAMPGCPAYQMGYQTLSL
jgi:hypothetical protein